MINRAARYATYRLQSPNDRVRDSVRDSLAVVDATCNEGAGGGVRGELAPIVELSAAVEEGKNRSDFLATYGAVFCRTKHVVQSAYCYSKSSVCASVCQSVKLRYRGRNRIGWITLKVIT